MELLIIRHAIAFERDPDRWPDDAARPLTPAGIRRSRKAAAGIKTLCNAPDRLLSSPLIRARETAGILTEAADWPRPEIVPELKPGKGADTVLALLAKGSAKRIAIVGHEPDLSLLLAACHLKGSHAFNVELKKNAVACLSFRGKVRPGSATLMWLATPRMLRGFRSR
jgi:phosphohistidine phosphatase